MNQPDQQDQQALPLWARVGAAGHVVSQLFLAPPDKDAVRRFNDPVMRATWPLDDAGTVAALGLLAERTDNRAAADEYERLLGRSGAVAVCESSYATDPADGERRLAEVVRAYRDSGLPLGRFAAVPADHLGLQLAYLAHGATAQRDPSPAVPAVELDHFRRVHVDAFAGKVLTEVEAVAGTPVYHALPALVRGFLQAHERLCAMAGAGV